MRCLWLAFILTGCAVGQGATDGAQAKLESEQVGRHVDQFFQRYGLPHARYSTADGGTLFEWHSDVSVFTMPDTTAFNTITGTATVTDGATLKSFCRVQLKANAAGVIERAKIMADTLGHWRLSRCSEIL